MQSHAPPPGGPAGYATAGPPPQRFTPPTAVHIPIQAVRSIIPQLATAINEIDGLNQQIAAGNVNGSMPSWDTLLQRYALLLTRVQSLTKYVSEPPRSVLGGAGPRDAGGKGEGGASGVGGGSSATSAAAVTAPPALAHYLVHPLRPLTGDVNPLAPDVLFQAINTTALPLAEEAGAEAESGAGVRGMHGLPALSGMDDASLTRLTDGLRARLGRESARARAMAAEIERRADEYDWTYRPDADGDEEEEEGDAAAPGGGGQGAAQATSAAATDNDTGSDLFGDDDDEDMAEVDTTTAQAATAPAELPPPLAPNPRQGWAVADYLAFLDGGRVPPSAAA